LQSFDILVIGGGPAGSTLAYCLKHTGLKIGILDRKSFPRQKICAGWVTPEVMRLLNVDLEDYSKTRVLQKIHGFKISQLGQKQVESFYPGDPVSYGIRRFEFDHYLLQRCGAQLILGEALKKMDRNNEGWLVNGKYQAKLIVGAGGHGCPVARNIGSKKGSELVVAAQEAEFEMDDLQKEQCTIRQDIPELFFTPDLKGYGWVFRKGDYLNIGLGREDKSRLSSHVKAFCDYLIRQGKIPDNISAKYNGHAYLLYPHAVRKMLADNVLLIGDSVGLAYPKSGEGIRPAVESAIMAADVIRSCESDYRINKLQPYQELVEHRYGRRSPGLTAIEKLPMEIKRVLAGNLMKTKWFTKKIVTDRWFLQSRQPTMPAIQE
jgi:geranylgeranyl reductase family protein